MFVPMEVSSFLGDSGWYDLVMTLCYAQKLELLGFGSVLQVKTSSHGNNNATLQLKLFA